jgi:anti-anti-sigma factor
MLRAEMQDSEKGLVIRLEGRFAGEHAEQVRMLVTRRNIERRLVIDLTEVTFIDSAGEATLSFFSRLGAKFVAEDVYVLDVCRRLNLPPLARNRKRGKAAPLVNASRAADQG